MSIRWTIQAVILLCYSGGQVICPGKFEASLVRLNNHRGVTHNGRCCSGPATYPPCFDHCNTFFTICLMQHIQYMLSKRVCPYGSSSTGVVGGNDISADVLLSVTINFTWPVNFTLIFESWHDVDGSQQVYDSSQLISQSFVSTELYPSRDWQGEISITPASEQHFRYRLSCAEHYYGPGCDILCKSRDDKHGHYKCDENGTKVCILGWDGTYCNKPMCSEECQRNKGHCERPNQCRCLLYWTGTDCSQCQTHRRCLHGYCHRPHQCICRAGWLGHFCDIDIAYCSKWQPCLHGGTCISSPTGNYTCLCGPGYTGTNCQYPLCYPGHCQNNGVCIVLPGALDCQCQEGYHGDRCQHKILSCDEKICQNGGYCEERRHGGHCVCLAEYTGKRCGRRIDPCRSNPCRNDGECQLSNISDTGFHCMCRSGFHGNTCSYPVNPCANVNCLHDGKCVYQIDNSQPNCACTSEFTGQFCEQLLDPCLGVKCLHSGTCKPMGNGFFCSCRPGYHGELCEVRMDPCASSPCINGGVCRNRFSRFRCHCTDQFSGKMCELWAVQPTSPTRASTIDTNIKVGENDTGINDIMVGESDTDINNMTVGENDTGLNDMTVGENDTGLNDITVGENDTGLNDIKVGENDTGLNDITVGENDTDNHDVGIINGAIKLTIRMNIVSCFIFLICNTILI